MKCFTFKHWFFFSFLIDPQNGQELDTLFTASAALWTDTQLPLIFEFGFVVAPSAKFAQQSESSDEFLPYSLIQSASVKAFAESQLPAGLPQAGGAVILCVQVFDSLNANASKHAIVTVAPSFVGNDELLGLIQNQLSGGSFDSIKQTISIAR